jgi:glycosyltransferase involved in cell wall biosynthesis
VKLLYISNGNIPSKWAHTFQAMKMAEALAQQVGDVTLLTQGSLLPGPAPAVDLRAWYDIGPELQVLRLPLRLLRSSTYFTHSYCNRFDRVAPAVARWLRPDLVYTRSTGAGVACVRANLPSIIETHRDPDARLAALGEVSARAAFLGLVTVTPALRSAYVEAGLPASKIQVLPDAVDPRRFQQAPCRQVARQSLGLPSDGPVVVYCGHFYEFKGVPCLVDAARLIPEITLVLVGGWPADIETMRLRAAGARNLRFEGFVSNGRVPTYLSAADVLVLPNSARFDHARYTSPLKLFEYMAAERPIVATDIPALNGVLQHRRNAFVVPADDAQALARGIRTVLADPALAQSLVSAAHAHVRPLTWRRRAAEILERLAPWMGRVA